jgi:hypothetical protein
MLFQSCDLMTGDLKYFEELCEKRGRKKEMRGIGNGDGKCHGDGERGFRIGIRGAMDGEGKIGFRKRRSGVPGG